MGVPSCATKGIASAICAPDCEICCRRILLKLSGEALQGKQGFGIDYEVSYSGSRLQK